MRLVIQRVSSASVTISGKVYSSIGKGLLVLVGIEEGDKVSDAEWLSGKTSQLRVFDDEHGVMNLSVTDVNGELMVISQFTLHASTRKGNRPSYIRAARPETAMPLYEKFITLLHEKTGLQIKTGVFGADMQVSLVNDGPVTLIIDSKLKE
jgi:D-tyrosyl-tRNA(Tyr) deacylase